MMKSKTTNSVQPTFFRNLHYCSLSLPHLETKLVKQVIALQIVNKNNVNHNLCLIGDLFPHKMKPYYM